MARTWITCLVVASTLAGTGLTGAERPALAEVEKRFGPPVLWVPKPEAAPVIDGTLAAGAKKWSRPFSPTALITWV